MADRDLQTVTAGKFSPGPLVRQGRSDSELVNFEAVGRPGQPPIAYFVTWADAALFAAAADLYAALADARQRMMGSSPAIRALIAKTDAALTKARGLEIIAASQPKVTE